MAPGGSAQQEDPYISADWPIRREKETSAEYLYTTKVRKLVECRGREGTRDIVAQADIKRKFAEQTLAAAYMGRERKLAACRAEMQGRCGE